MAMDMIGGRFEVERKAGVGGMGMVFRARDRHTGQLVALKVMSDNGSDASRFTREAQTLSEIRHPAVVRYVAHGIDISGSPYLAMQWLDGEDLAARLRRGPITPVEALALARRVAAALAAVHARGIVHRDVKPSNLFLVDGNIDAITLIDFGVVRTAGTAATLTRTGDLIGTPAYAAPEQVRGERDVDARVDVHALGCVLFECLTGKPPYFAEQLLALLGKVLLEEPPSLAQLRPDLPPKLDRLIARFLAKDPNARPPDGAAAASELETVTLDIDATASASTYPSRRPELTGEEQRIATVILSFEVPSAAEETVKMDLEATVNVADDVIARARALGARVEALANGALFATLAGGNALDQARLAARCAFVLHGRAESARTVIATARGVLVGKSAVGEVLDRAGHMLEQSRKESRNPAPIRVDETTAALLDGRFDVVRREAHFELVGEPTTALPTRTLLGRPSPYVGREAELRSLAGLLDECITLSEARAALVIAPAGVGKTRLSAEFLRTALQEGRDIELWFGRCEPMYAGAAFGIISALTRGAAHLMAGEPLETTAAKLRKRLAQSIPEPSLERVTCILAELVNAEAGTPSSEMIAAVRNSPALFGQHLRRAWFDWIRAETSSRPLVVVLDDLHWGDAPSINLFDVTLREFAERPLYVLALGRPEVEDSFPKLWADRGPHVIRLRELGKRASELIARRALGDVASDDIIARVVKSAAGNALFLEELLRAVADGKGDTLPDTVLAMIEARLDRLPVEHRRVLRAASVFGDVFWESSVCALAGHGKTSRDVSAILDDLVGAEIVMERGEEKFPGERAFGFRHALVRDAAYAMLIDADRKLAHRLAADWLEASGELEASVIAEHLERCDEPWRAGPAYGRAALQALRRNAFAAALSFSERWVPLHTDEDGAAERLALRARAYAGLTRWADARREFEAALALLDGRHSTALECQIRNDLIHICIWMSDFAAVRPYSERSLVLAKAAARPKDAAGAMMGLAMATFADGDFQGGFEWLERSVEATGEAYSPYVLGFYGLALYWRGRTQYAIQVAERDVAALRRLNDTQALLMSLPHLAVSLAAIGRYREAFGLFAEVRTLARSAGAMFHSRLVSFSVGPMIEIFDYDRALGIIDEMERIERSGAHTPAFLGASIDRLFCVIRKGDIDAALRIEPTVTDELANHTKGWHAWLWRGRMVQARAELALASGALRDAVLHANESIGESRERLRPKYEALGLEVRGLATAKLGDVAAGAADLRLAVEVARRTENPAEILRALCALIEVEPDNHSIDEAMSLVKRIEVELPDDSRARFVAADPVARVRQMAASSEMQSGIRSECKTTV